MAIKLNTITETFTPEFRTVLFQVSTPPGSDPWLQANYDKVSYGKTGNVVSEKHVATLILNKTQLVTLLTGNNPYGLPSFPTLYSGLRNFFDTQFQINFSGLMP